jgi:hypothetical protein
MATFPSVTRQTLVLEVRGGYLLPVGRVVLVWPRAGFTYARGTGDVATFGAFPGTTGTTVAFYAVSVEALAAVRLLEHVLLMAGPSLDFGFRGAIETRMANGPLIPNRSARETDVGAACAIAAYF